jgi:Rieske Fe-S protein
MNSPDLNPKDNDFSRRRFCLLACTAATVASLPLAAEPPPPEPPRGPRRVTAETRATLTKGVIKDYRKPGGFFLIGDAGGIYAVSSTCTHKGCTVHLEGNTGFGCPCHDSEYDLQGAVIEGPATLPLKHFEVSEQNPGGPLVVDLSRTVDPLVRL